MWDLVVRLAWMGDRDLARACPARLLDRQCPENLLFGQVGISKKFFHVNFLWVKEGNLVVNYKFGIHCLRGHPWSSANLRKPSCHGIKACCLVISDGIKPRVSLINLVRE